MATAPRTPKTSFLTEVGQDLRLALAKDSDFLVGWKSVDDEVLDAVESLNEARAADAKAALLKRLAKR